MVAQVTIAICTWNRADLLDKTLAGMRQLRIPSGVNWELLVVNNRCTDHTDEVIARHAGDLPLLRLFEPKQGLSNARNCAVSAARGNMVLWTDDDVLVDPEWLAEYVAAAGTYPEAAFFGGTVDPWFAVEPPNWIRGHLHQIGNTYAIRQLGTTVRPLAPEEFPYGANMAFRRDVFQGDDFDSRLGRTGHGTLSGEETDLINRLRKAGRLGVWVGTARVQHYIAAERLTKKYIWDYYRGQGQTLLRRSPPPLGPSLWGAPRWAVRKYMEARLKAWVFAPFKGSRWLGAFVEAALCRGIIEESRQTARA